MYIDYVQCIHKEKHSVTFEALGYCVGNILVAKAGQVSGVEKGKFYRLLYEFSWCEQLRVRECTEISCIPKVRHTIAEVPYDKGLH